MSARHFVLAAALLAPTLATAQDGPKGEMTFQINAAMPAALAAQAPIQKVPTIRMQFGGNGSEVAMKLTISPDGADPMVAAMADASIRAIWPVKGDSAHLAIAIPGQMQGMVAQMLAPGASPAGYRMSFKFPNIDSLVAANRDKINMEMKDDGPSVAPVALGTTSTVAGMTCENWRVIAPTDSMKTKSDTIDMCVVPSGTMQFAMGEWFAKKFNLHEAMQKTELSKFFGGRMMYPVKVAASNGSFAMEVVSVSNTPPDASFFTIPADYHKVDPKSVPFPGAGGQ